jgi:hypothetical protein
MHFGALKTKIAVARENSANFDCLTKTAHFQKCFKNTSQIARHQFVLQDFFFKLQSLEMYFFQFFMKN